MNWLMKMIKGGLSRQKQEQLGCRNPVVCDDMDVSIDRVEVEEMEDEFSCPLEEYDDFVSDEEELLVEYENE